MTQNGLVLSTDGKTAIVEVTRKNACEGCHNRKGCRNFDDCSKIDRINVKVNNPVNAKPGDHVEVETSTVFMTVISFFVFVLPTVVSIALYLFLKRYISSIPVLYLISIGFFIALCAVIYRCLDSILKNRIVTSISKIYE